MCAVAVGLSRQARGDHSHWFCLAAVDPRLEALRSDSPGPDPVTAIAQVAARRRHSSPSSCLHRPDVLR